MAEKASVGSARPTGGPVKESISELKESPNSTKVERSKIGKSERWKRLLIISLLIILATPVFSSGAGVTGQDWYCSEPVTHTDNYKRHLKLHIAHGADSIAAKLEKIFNNQSLTTEEKQLKTIEILNRYLVQAKAGIGD